MKQIYSQLLFNLKIIDRYKKSERELFIACWLQKEE